MQRKINDFIKNNRRQSVFGELGPGDKELIQLLLFDDNGNRIGYVTGPALYNKLWLTTQVPAHINVASTVKRKPIKIRFMRVSFAKSYCKITDENYRFLEILDALRGFKRISDLDEKMVVKRLSVIIKELTVRETQQLVECALEYPPRVRAFLGAILARQRRLGLGFEKLAASLNQATIYCLRISQDVMATATLWNIE